jgi:transposase
MCAGAPITWISPAAAARAFLAEPGELPCWFREVTACFSDDWDTELLPKSNSEPVRRLEVFTGSGRRRAWTAEQKARIIAETYESGATVSAAARRHGLTPQQLFSWRRHVRQGAQERSGDSSTAFCAGDCGSTPARRGHTNRAETGDRNRGRRHDGSGCARDRGVRMRPRNSSRKHRTHPTSVDGAD